VRKLHRVTIGKKNNSLKTTRHVAQDLTLDGITLVMPTFLKKVTSQKEKETETEEIKRRILVLGRKIIV
jgi:hypothetical protein